MNLLDVQPFLQDSSTAEQLPMLYWISLRGCLTVAFKTISRAAELRSHSHFMSVPLKPAMVIKQNFVPVIEISTKSRDK